MSENAATALVKHDSQGYDTHREIPCHSRDKLL